MTVRACECVCDAGTMTGVRLALCLLCSQSILRETRAELQTLQNASGSGHWGGDDDDDDTWCVGWRSHCVWLCERGHVGRFSGPSLLSEIMAEAKRDDDAIGLGNGGQRNVRVRRANSDVSLPNSKRPYQVSMEELFKFTSTSVKVAICVRAGV